MHLDVELTLGWNLVEAATTGITLHVDDTQSVACVFADTLERREQTRLNLLFKHLGLLLEFLLFGTGFLHDFAEFALLDGQVALLFLDNGFVLYQLLVFLGNATLSLIDFLVAQFYFERLELNLLARIRDCCALR